MQPKPDLEHLTECSTEFCPVGLLDLYEAFCSKYDLYSYGFAAGLPGITLEMVEEAAKLPAQILGELCKNYPQEVVRRGSIKHRYDLPQFFRNQSGSEVPGDIEVIRKMAAARGQVLK